MSRMNAGLILAGQQPDFVNTLARSNEAAAFKNEMNRQNALRQLYQQQGAGILAGEQGALNALAGFDPMAALGVQNTIAGNRMAEQNFDMRRQEFDLRMQEYKKGIGAEQAAQEAARIKQAVSAASAAQTPQEWDAIVSQYGEAGQQFVGRFAERESIIRGLLDISDALARDAVPEPADEYGRYVQEERAAGREPLSRIEYGRAKQKTQRIEVGADGSVKLSEGFGGEGDVKFTEAQGKDNVYSTRARGALEALEPVADALASRGDKILGAVPLGIGREFQEEDYQVAEQAGTEFLQAILRKDTGAAITQGEIDSYGVTYLPQPGDGPAVLEAKRIARVRAIEALESGMNASQMLARDRALIKTAEATGQVKAAPGDFSQMSEDELLQVDPGSLEGEQQKAFIKALEDALNGR